MTFGTGRARCPFIRRAGLLGGAGLLVFAGCDRAPVEAPVEASGPATVSVGSVGSIPGFEPAVARRVLRASPLPDLPPDPTNRVADDPLAAAFGRTLFFDPGLSIDGSVSCATCHQPELLFTDGLTRSQGIATAGRHSPSLLDAAHQRWFNWDGRSDSMWAHAIRPIEHPDEMGGDRTAVARHVLGDRDRRATYESIFGPTPLDPEVLPERARPEGDAEARAAWAGLDDASRLEIDRIAANLGKAMAAYQRTLTGGETRFDRWVSAVRAGGDPEVRLEPSELRGMKLFFGQAECWECHAGPLFSDGEFHNIGTPVVDGLPRDPGRYDGAALVVADPFNAAGVHSDDPEGDQAIVSRGVKRDPGQWGAFRTPSLRGVASTPPYMHDGSMADLESVVRFYSTLEGAIQLDHHQESVLSVLDLSPQELEDLVAFLGTLDPIERPMSTVP